MKNMSLIIIFGYSVIFILTVILFYKNKKHFYISEIGSAIIVAIVFSSAIHQIKLYKDNFAPPFEKKQETEKVEISYLTRLK